MSRRSRIGLFGIAAVPLLCFVVWALSGLPDFGYYSGEYGRLLAQVAVAQRHTTNVVGAIVFDYRGLDTLGEEFILFSSAMGITFLLRGQLKVKEQRPRDLVSSDATRVVGAFMVPVTIVAGLWLATYGYVTPGGGFQGGVAVASGVVLVWLATSYRRYARMTPSDVVDALEGSGASAYVIVGLIGIALGGSYLANFLPLGKTGTVAAGGSIGLLNWASALEVSSANVLIYREFLQEYIQTFPGVEEES